MAIRETVTVYGTYSAEGEWVFTPLRLIEGGRSNVASAEEADLEFWFTRAESVLGVRSAGFGGGGGTSVWDEARSAAAHLAKLERSYRREVQRAIRVGRAVALLAPADHAILADVFAPRRWSPIRPPKRAALERKKRTKETLHDDPTPDTLARATRRPHEMGCLAGICVHTSELVRAWARRERAHKREPGVPTRAELLTLLQDECSGIAGRRWLRPILDEAEGYVQAALARFALVRTGVEGAVDAARADALAEILAGTEALP